MVEIVKAIQQFLGNQIGLNPDSLNANVWQSAIDERMAATQISDAQDYLIEFLRNPKEQSLLMEYMLVSETWFFRHEDAFRYLRHLIYEEWIKHKSHRKEPLRILCVPCSTGEEAFSIAMTFLESGVPGAWFSIDGIDLSLKSIEEAKKGIFKNYSFRNKDDYHRDNFFMFEKGQYRLLDLVKQQVHFREGNIVDPHFLVDESPYDIIFCRNLFIYLQASGLAQVRKNIQRLLKNDGLLFVGPVEVQLVRSWGFNSIGPAAAAAFTKQTIVEEKVSMPLHPKRNLMEEARKDADEGNFETAHKKCMLYLEENHADPEGYFLLGVLEHAQGNEESAERNFRKAVYLSPTHEEALVYLALLAEKRGKVQEAKQLRERLKKI